MIDLLFLGIDAWLIYMGIKHQNYILLILVAVSLMIDLMGAIQVLIYARW